MNRLDEVVLTLARARVKAGLSQREVGVRVGVCRRTVWQWESRRCVPRLKAAEEWHRVLGVEPPADLPDVCAPAKPGPGGWAVGSRERNDRLARVLLK